MSLESIGGIFAAAAAGPRQIIRSPQWTLSAVGVVLFVAGVLWVAFVAAFVAVQHP